jgi:Domain of unknown function (DUF5615)
VRLLLDHHLSPIVAVELRRIGHDAVVTHERGWSRLRDHDLLEAVAGERRALVTADLKDFVPLARSWAESQREHWGLLLVSRAAARARSDGIGRPVELLCDVLDRHPAEDAFRNRVHWL